ncbi:MAG: substrate-binding domain-containing protein, partial [Paucibacter sp.]|nr:substrate-binding domain-containing protein [Roseateles sp.]
LESTGGVDAARRLLDGEAFDVVVLASDAIAKLYATGRLRPGSIRPLADSSVAIAVQAGAAPPDVSSKEALHHALLQARAIGYSTGPSGMALMDLIERWGLTDRLQPKLVQARPGVPVARLLATGEVEIGFQQLSEMQGLPGIALLGGMPPGLEIVSRFCGAVAAAAAHPDAAQALLEFMAGPATAALKQRHGMQAVQD